MKSLIILFADDYSDYGFKNSFDGKSAFIKTLEWAKKVCDSESSIAIFCFDKNKELVEKSLSLVNTENFCNNEILVKSKETWTNEILFAELSDSLLKVNGDYAIFTFAFNPFINFELTQNLICTHKNFMSEYCFADGFPMSVSPELLDKGLVNILSELIKTKEDLKNSPVTKTSIFDLIKTDINSFEIETEISTTDWRLYRFDFSCDKKENYIACCNLYEKIKDLSDEDKNDIQKICNIAAKNVKVLKTIPAYFNIQISNEYQTANPYCAYKLADELCSQINNQSTEQKFLTEKMSFKNFKFLISKINELNPNAVISLSLWGDPVLHPEFFDFVNEVLSYPELSVLIETDGFDFSKNDGDKNSIWQNNLQALSEKVKKCGIRKNGFSPIMWLINVDAMTQNVFEKLHPGQKIENTLYCVKLLNSLFPECVYAQYLRTLENEDELENFYRTFKEKDSFSSGNFVIQKYDHFCKRMPQVKSADLAPIERNPCWHLRRDFNIMADGKVPLCREFSFENVIGNAFDEDLETIWNRIDSVLQNDVDKKYCKLCEACDEYYTYNF